MLSARTRMRSALGLDQRSVNKIGIVRVGRAKRIDDGGLDFGCGHAGDSSGLAPAALSEDRGHVVAIADAALLGRARGHPVAAIVEDAADEQSARRCAPDPCSVAIGRELLLNRIEQGRRDDRGMLGRIARSLVVQLAKIDPVPEDVSERTIGQRHTADRSGRS